MSHVKGTACQEFNGHSASVIETKCGWRRAGRTDRPGQKGGASDQVRKSVVGGFNKMLWDKWLGCLVPCL